VPRIRRTNVPAALFRHLLDRVRDRRIPPGQLQPLARWLDQEPEVPEGKWYRKFPAMTVCGEGELVKTFLLPGQHPEGKRVGS
jgi:hypothetical protein